MIVLMTPETDIDSETQLVNQLFSLGLDCFHIRKPLKDRKEHSAYLNAIDASYHPRIVLHQHHDLTNEFDLKGIHFDNQQRKDYIETPIRYFKDLNLFGKTISSSFDLLDELVASDFEFDYHILDSLNTTSKLEFSRYDVSTVDKFIVDKGNIDLNNPQEISSLGYEGIAISEIIWDSNDPVKRFLDLTAVYNSIILHP